MSSELEDYRQEFEQIEAEAHDLLDPAVVLLNRLASEQFGIPVGISDNGAVALEGHLQSGILVRVENNSFNLFNQHQREFESLRGFIEICGLP